MGMWDTIKRAKAEAPINVVNGDVKVVEEIDGGTKQVMTDTAPAAFGERPKFKPVRSEADFLAEQRAELAKPAPPPSNNFDLVGDDMGNPNRTTNGGRPRLYPNDAARQKAYRDRKKTSG